MGIFFGPLFLLGSINSGANNPPSGACTRRPTFLIYLGYRMALFAAYPRNRDWLQDLYPHKESLDLCIRSDTWLDPSVHKFRVYTRIYELNGLSLTALSE